MMKRAIGALMKRAIGALAAVLAVSILTAAPTLAQSRSDRPLKSEETDDLMCVMVYSMVAAQEGQVPAGAAGMLYFFGRLEGRDPATDWLERFGKFAYGVSDVDLAAHGQRCGQALVDKGKAMVQLGEKMSANAEDAQ